MNVMSSYIFVCPNVLTNGIMHDPLVGADQVGVQVLHGEIIPHRRAGHHPDRRDHTLADVAPHHLLAHPQRLRRHEATIRREERVLRRRVQRLGHAQRAGGRPRRVVGRDGFGCRRARVAGSSRGSGLLQGRDRHIQQVRIVVDEDVLHRLGLRLPCGRVVRQHLVAHVQGPDGLLAVRGRHQRCWSEAIATLNG